MTIAEPAASGTHLADRFVLPEPYRARPYVGRADHPAMVRVLRAHREATGDDEMPTLAAFEVSYANLDGCDPATDIALVEDRSIDDGDGVVAYVRALREDVDGGTRDLIVFTPTLPAHLDESLVGALIDGVEAHMRPWAQGPTRFRGWAPREAPEVAPTGIASWYERRGYVATEWGAQLVRPHLDDIPRRPLPDGVEVRPVTPDQVRQILEADFEAFRGEWDFHEPTEADIALRLDDPWRDESLWKVAWAGDTVVGQVRSYINADENAARGYRRGYTENISTHRDWRHRGIAGALLVQSLEVIRERGMTEAALGVDTNNPGGAFHLYTSLGFEPRSMQAVYTKPL